MVCVRCPASKVTIQCYNTYFKIFKTPSNQGYVGIDRVSTWRRLLDLKLSVPVQGWLIEYEKFYPHFWVYLHSYYIIKSREPSPARKGYVELFLSFLGILRVFNGRGENLVYKQVRLSSLMILFKNARILGGLVFCCYECLVVVLIWRSLTSPLIEETDEIIKWLA